MQHASDLDENIESHTQALCLNSADCDDDNSCTTDLCLLGACSNVALTNCCQVAEDCAPEPCKLATCTLSLCLYGDDPGCTDGGQSGSGGVSAGGSGGGSSGASGSGASGGAGGTADAGSAGSGAVSGAGSSSGSSGEDSGGASGAGSSSGSSGVGAGGAGGEAASGGNGGLAGQSGSGGADSGASGGQGGDAGNSAGSGAAGGQAGNAGSTSGDGGDAGSSGGAGDAGNGASAGSAGSGDESGGSGGQSGSAGSDGGTGAGGSGASGGTGAGGSGASGGSDGDGGSGASSGAGVAPNHAVWRLRGGSCAVSASSRAPAGSWLALALALVVMRRCGRRSRRYIGALTLVAATATVRQGAAASFNTDLYTSPAHPDDLFWVERAAPQLGHVRPFLRVALTYADDSLEAVNDANPSESIEIIDSRVGLHPSVGVALFEHVSLALRAPVYFQSGTALFAGTDPNGAALGNPGLDARFILLGREAPLELSLAGALTVPPGTSDSLAADAGVGFWPRVLLASSLGGRSFIGLGVGPRLRRSATLGDLSVGSELVSTAGVLVGASDLLGFTLECAGSTLFSDMFSASGTPFEGTAGVRLDVSPFVVAFGGGAGLSSGFGAPDARLLTSFAYQPAAATVARTAAQPTAAPAFADRDADGIADTRDRCPEQAEDRDTWQDSDGCLDPDNDQDGALDGADRCPEQAEDRDAFEDGDGCPDTDDDADKVADSDDRCRQQPEDRDGWEDTDGCPDLDNDADGIADASDKCPNEAEPKNGVDDTDGCPDLIRVEADQIRTLEPIYFELNRAQILQRSESLLLEMAHLIIARPDLGQVSIEGHTDSRGAATHNLQLSDERARAVRQFLVDAGVPPERLRAQGYGSVRPIDDNQTAAGRARNRRVEFQLGVSP